MDDRRFDSLVRMLGAGGSRRSVLKGLLGLGGAAVVGSSLLERDTDAARRPTPTPKPVKCPGQQTPVNGVCTCPGAAPYKCGSDCCTAESDDPPTPNHSECCDNACCVGTCYGEELCCPTNDRPGELPPTHQICNSANGVECCTAGQPCCEVDGCCDTVCWGGQDDTSNCCSEGAYCPGNDSPDLCCTNNFTCCGGGTSGNACLDPSQEGICCTDADCQADESCIDNRCVPDDPNAPCQPGYYRNEGTCTPCAGGFASPDGITCERCGPGTAAQSGSAQCQECEPGYYTDDSENDECNSCPPGRYASESGSTECTECPLGTFSDTNAATVCTPCPAGTYTEHVMSTECIACDCEAGSMPEVCGCLPDTCLPGQYLAESECVDCSAGTYSDLPDSVFCKPCDLNTYQDLPGQSSCVACADGFYTEFVGALECTECNCALGDMPLICDCDTPCEAGYAPDGFGMCAACDEGSASFDGSACVPCAAGRFATGAANIACTPCAPGTYADDIGAGICDACPAGSFVSTSGAVGCSPCDCGATCDPQTGICPGGLPDYSACAQDSDCASNQCGCNSPPGFPECFCRTSTCRADGVDCAGSAGAVVCCEGDCTCFNGNTNCFCTNPA